MRPGFPTRWSAKVAAIILVTSSAVTGIVACIFGALNWGLLGLGGALVGAWTLFLVGLFALYRREQLRPDPMDPSEVRTVEPAVAPPPVDEHPASLS